MDELRRDRRWPAAPAAFPSTPDDPGPSAPDGESTHIDDFRRPDPAPSSPPPGDRSGVVDAGSEAGEGQDEAKDKEEDELPSWSSEVSLHASWSLPESFMNANPQGPDPSPTVKPAGSPGHPHPSPLGSYDAPPSGSGSGSGHGSGMPPPSGGPSPTDGFDSDEVDRLVLTEGRVLFRKYVLKKKLGSGGMGEVWKVHHIELDCDRALKFIRTGLAPSPELRERFRREARVMAKVSHPNAVEIHDAFTVGGMAFIEMAYVSGRSLVEILQPGQPMPLDWTVRILQSLCEVLAVAHEAGIVHRDLKPANLMLLNDRKPGREFLKVLDFGIAKLLSIEEGDGPSITNNAPIGTYPYMSPEQFGTASVDTRSDIYTTGVILFEFLTGFRPYSAKNQLHPWFQMHVKEPIPQFVDRNADVDLPAEVEEVVRRCLAKSPDDRPQSAQALFEEFEAASGLVRPQPRSGSSSYITKIPPPRSRGTDSARTVHGYPIGPEREPELDFEPDEPTTTPGSETSPSGPRIEPGDNLGSGGQATDSGSFEFVLVTNPESQIAQIPAPSPVDRVEGKPGPSEPPEVRRPSVIWKALAAVGLVLGTIGGAGAYYLAGSKPAKDPVVETKEIVNPPENPVKPTITGFQKSSKGRLSREGLDYDPFENASGWVGYLPSGYRPKGIEAAEDGWPKVIARRADGVEFLRIVGMKYKTGKLPWRPGERNPEIRLKPDEVDDVKDPSLPEGIDIAEVPGFYIQKYEVTNAEMMRYYEAVKNDPALDVDIERWHTVFKKDFDPQHLAIPTRPAVFMSCRAARIYARSVGGDLPNSSQWRVAASSRDKQADFVWGIDPADLTTDQQGQICLGEKKWPEKVGQSSRDVTEQEVFDMGGNVREWVRDERFQGLKACGGCFSERFSVAECWIKSLHEVEESSKTVGFRVVLECPEATASPSP